MTPLVLAADVGGTEIRAALVDPKGSVLLRRSVPTPADADVPASLTDLIAMVAAESDHGVASHAVVGLPGVVDYEEGRLLWAPHLPELWPEQLSAEGLTAHLGLPVSIANDADLAAVGEAWFGAGAPSMAVAYLTISTGIGAGVVHAGRVLRGTRSLAEVGHAVVDWRAWRDGAPSTLEELGSGSGVARLAREAGLGEIGAREVQAGAAAGDPVAVAIWEQAIAACAAGVSNLVMSFYPSTVVVGGGLGRQDDLGPLRDMVLQRPAHHPDDLAIVRSALGDDAGLSGAAAWVRAIQPRLTNSCRALTGHAQHRSEDLGMVLELATKLQYNPLHTGRTQSVVGSPSGVDQDKGDNVRFSRAGTFGGLSLALSATLIGVGGGGASASVRASGPSNITVSSFTNNFSVMKQFKSLAAAGKGKVAAILPDTVSSTRYVEFDQPDITKALQTAGLSSSQYVVQNALGSDTTQLTDAQTDISNGATVLLVDPLDSGVGSQIETYAKSRGVKVIDYDRLTLGGSRAYYVSFNNVKVGQVMGKGLVSCVAAWKIKKPQVVVMHGAVTDNNATLFAQGYDSVINPMFKSGKWSAVAHTAGTWDPPTAETEFQAVFTAHHNVNSALIPNDETGAPIITYLQSLHVKPKSFPTTGQDATLTGLQNVLAGYQCGTVYKPIYLEAQSAVALALYLRAGAKPPASLANGKTQDTTAKVSVPSVLLSPTWVTPTNMNATVVKDNFVPASQLCTGSFSADCTAADITP